MLGEILVEEVGTAAEMTDLGDNKVEIKLATKGTVKGVDQTSAWTYWMETRADGSIQGEGHGVMTTADGDVINLRGIKFLPNAGHSRKRHRISPERMRAEAGHCSGTCELTSTGPSATVSRRERRKSCPQEERIAPDAKRKAAYNQPDRFM